MSALKLPRFACLLACSSQRKDAAPQSPAATCYCLSPVSQLVINLNEILINQMAFFDCCSTSVNALAVLLLHPLPLLAFSAVALLCPVAANHPGQLRGQGMVTIPATHQVMGQVVLVFITYSWGGGCQAVYPFPQGTLLFPRHPP